MISAADSSGSVERILIVRLSAMGDVIHTLPAVHALRQAFPHAMIGWLIEERWAELLCSAGSPRRGLRSPERPLVDWVHTVKLREWGRSAFTLSTALHAARVWNDVREARYDLAVDLQGAIRSAVLARWSGARVVWGGSEPRESPASLWYTRRALGRGTHVIQQNLSISEAVAETRFAVPSVALPQDASSEARVDRRLWEAGVRDFAILNPGAGWGAKRWPAERYGVVAKSLAIGGLRSVIHYGPGEEALASVAVGASDGTATPFQGSIGDLTALTRRARLFIGGDTGPLHLAAALRVPVVAIFGPTDPARNGPYGTSSIVLRNPASPTTHSRREQADESLLAISSEEVIEAARKLLAANKGGGKKCPPPHELTPQDPDTEGAHG